MDEWDVGRRALTRMVRAPAVGLPVRVQGTAVRTAAGHMGIVACVWRRDLATGVIAPALQVASLGDAAVVVVARVDVCE